MGRPAPAASRAVAILDFLIAHPTEPFSLSQIARANRMNVASASTVLTVLTDAGYVVRHPSNKMFVLGPLLVAAGHATLEQYPAIDVARDEIRRMSSEFGVELLLTVPAGGDIVAVARAGRPDPTGLEVGRRLPLVPPLGAIFVAWEGEQAVDEWVRRAGGDREDEIDWYRRILESTRSRGFSVTIRPSNSRDVISEAVAAAIDDPSPSKRNALHAAFAGPDHGAYHLSDLSEPGPHHVRMIAAPVFDADQRVILAITLLDFQVPLSAFDIAAWGKRLRDVGMVVTRGTRGERPSTVFA
jgi:DNA-binding IclR family transcriptional regulator